MFFTAIVNFTHIRSVICQDLQTYKAMATGCNKLYKCLSVCHWFSKTGNIMCDYNDVVAGVTWEEMASTCTVQQNECMFVQHQDQYYTVLQALSHVTGHVITALGVDLACRP